MSDESSRSSGEWSAENAGISESEEIEITSVEAVDADAPPPSAGDQSSETDGGQAEASFQSGGEGAPDSAVPGEDGAPAGDQIAGLEDDLLRIRAEFENFRKRQQRERTEILRHASSGLMERLLPALDNFKRAMDAPAEDEATAGFRDGITMIFRQFLDVLEREGLQRIPTCGEMFDPNLHEAVAREETGEVEPNTITLELEPGYRFQDRLLKPARVRVAVAPEDDS
jgi:molecular chaperone GrpE